MKYLMLVAELIFVARGTIDLFADDYQKATCFFVISLVASSLQKEKV